jgi:hypothetical protein
MNDMNVTVAQYMLDMGGVATVIKATIDGTVMSVPMDPANRHYAEILKQVEEGTLVVQPADEN